MSYQRILKDKPADTVCLKCGEKFTARSKYNRVCGVCRATNRALGRFGGGINTGVRSGIKG